MAEREPHYAGAALDTLPPRPRHAIHAVADNVRSAYNVGSFFRTADACAIECLHLCGMSAHPPHVKLAKTALGAFDYVPWKYYERTKDCIAGLREAGIPVIGIEVSERAVDMDAFTWPEPVAVIFGNEVNGISDNNLARCDHVVQIPMHGYKNSMNVATAFGVVLYHIITAWKTTR
ncbi:MAG: TrmH family RNA methyltransferase [Candidatus Hydrogenedens sp.]|nr:TrmH family RNA methyltransferase [Candidatus Hydrogenedens sp.]